MSADKIKLLHRITRTVTSILAIIGGILLISACLQIYDMGDKPYSREIVSTLFSKIAVPIYLCLIAVIFGIGLKVICPEERARLKPVREKAEILRSLQSKIDSETISSSEEIGIERARRRIHTIVLLAILVISTALFLSYALNSSNFTMEDINASVISGVLVMLPCILVPFVYACVIKSIFSSSYERELSLTKELIKNGAKKATGVAENTKIASLKREFVTLWVARGIVFFVATALLIVGIASGGVAAVLAKAVKICTECIGLG